VSPGWGLSFFFDLFTDRDSVKGMRIVRGMGADEDIIGMIIRRDSYNILKKQMQGGDPNYVTSPSQHLLAAAEAS
jgi:hypothetical protein